jgi:hypothetical protein
MLERSGKSQSRQGRRLVLKYECDRQQSTVTVKDGIPEATTVLQARCVTRLLTFGRIKICVTTSTFIASAERPGMSPDSKRMRVRFSFCCG